MRFVGWFIGVWFLLVVPLGPAVGGDDTSSASLCKCADVTYTTLRFRSHYTPVVFWLGGLRCTSVDEAPCVLINGQVPLDYMIYHCSCENQGEGYMCEVNTEIIPGTGRDQFDDGDEWCIWHTPGDPDSCSDLTSDECLRRSLYEP
jgi:hypothetical protein